MILADENIDTNLVSILRSKGIKVDHISESNQNNSHRGQGFWRMGLCP